MDKLAACSHIFRDIELVNKCNEVEQQKQQIRDLEAKIYELEKKTGRIKIEADDYNDYCNKLTRVYDDLVDSFISIDDGFDLITEEGIDFDKELYINESIKNCLFNLTKDLYWSTKRSYSITRNLVSIINILSTEDNVGNSWNTYYDENINDMNTNIFDYIHDLMWAEPRGKGLLDDWEHGAIFVTKCKGCNKEIYPQPEDQCEGCLYHSSFS